MKKPIYIALAVAFSALMLQSCDMELTSPNDYDQDTFWHSAATARAGLTGCYSSLAEGGMFGGYTVALEECASPNAYNYHNNAGWNSIAMGTHTSDIGIVAARWKSAFRGIGRCNLLINNIGQNKELSADKIDEMRAEARFLRALYYHWLTLYYDKVPFSTDIASLSQWDLPRSDRSVIVNFLLQELEEISQILPGTRVKDDNGRPTSGAALALKTKILLFEASLLNNENNDPEKWRAVAKTAEAVMKKGYSLFPNYRNLFLEANENSAECIFDVQFIEMAKYGSSFDVVMRQYNGCAPLQGLIDDYWMLDGKPRAESSFINSTDYQNMDPRFYATVVYPGSTFMGETVKTNGTNSKFTIIQTGYTFKKYTVYDSKAPSATDVALGTEQSPTNYMVLRYADILLTYAEAKNELNELDENVWNKTIKPIRQRAGFSMPSALNYPGNDKDVLQKIIRYERRAEFAGEGFYYNDIRRWKTAETELNGDIKKFDGTVLAKRGFNSARDYWWPVPSVQIELAPTLLPNNPGWSSK